MAGFDTTTLQAISEEQSIAQSIKTILTTPLGSREMNRSFGSRLFDLVDGPVNSRFLLEIHVAVFEALLKWEKRIVPLTVQATQLANQKILMVLEYQIKTESQIKTLEVTAV